MSSYTTEDSEGVISYYLTDTCVNINAVSEDSKSESAIADGTSDRVISYHCNFIYNHEIFLKVVVGTIEKSLRIDSN